MSSIFSAPRITATTPSTISSGQVLFSTGSAVNGSANLVFQSGTNRLQIPGLVAAPSGNVPLVLSPSGNGALQLQTVDSTATGGNARGTNAIDLQTLRQYSFHVASGASSVVIGVNNASQSANSVTIGTSNWASANNAVALGTSNNPWAINSIALGIGNSVNALASNGVAVGSYNAVSSPYGCAVGWSNTVSGQGAVGIGAYHAVSGQYGFAGGYWNTVSGANATAFGSQNTASGINSFVTGSKGSTQGVECIMAIGVNFGAIVGSSYILPLIAETTNATPVRLSSGGSGSWVGGNYPVKVNSTTAFFGLIVASVTAGGDCSIWEFKGAIQRGGGNPGLVAPVTPPLITQKAGAASWTVSIAADASNNLLAITVTGEAGKTIRWACTTYLTESYF
jgi:hypothetical protein